MSKGIFYGVGVGPGDPELLTLKAVRILERCEVIAAPKTRSGETLALDIVRGAVSLEGKKVLPLHFTMSRDRSRWRTAHEEAARAVEQELEAGRSVAMPNLGDVSIYSTFGYLKTLLEERGYEAVMVPGVPSFCAAAARLGVSLCSGDAPLHIIPVGGGALRPLLEQPGGKVLMKAGRDLPQLVEALEETGQLDRSALLENCGLPGERVFRDLRQLPEDLGYFSTVLVRES